MKQQILQELHKEAEILGTKIIDLTIKRDLLHKVISEFDFDVIPEKDVKVKIQKEPKPAEKITAKKGAVKFSQYLIGLFQTEPDCLFNSKEITKLMDKAISAGKISPIPTKDLVSNVSAYLWYFTKKGSLEKSESDGIYIYKYSERTGKAKPMGKPKKETPKEVKEKVVESAGMGELEETIIEVIKSEKRITLPSLVNKIRLSEDFGHISKNLNGTLATSVENCLRELVKVNVLEWNTDNEYCLNPKTNF